MELLVFNLNIKILLTIIIYTGNLKTDIYYLILRFQTFFIDALTQPLSINHNGEITKAFSNVFTGLGH